MILCCLFFLDDISKYLHGKPFKRLLYTGKKEAIKPTVARLFDLSVRVLSETLDELPQRIYLLSK